MVLRAGPHPGGIEARLLSLAATAVALPQTLDLAQRRGAGDRGRASARDALVRERAHRAPSAE